MLGASFTFAHAGYALPSPPPGFSVTSAGYMYRAPAGVAAVNGAFQTGVSVNVAGKSVTVPAAMRLASNAPSFVVNAVKSRVPWAMIGAVALWAITDSMSWDDDQQQWVSVGATGGATYHVFINSQGASTCSTIQEACSKEQVWNAVAAHVSQGHPYTFGSSWSSANGYTSTDEHIEVFWSGGYSIATARGRGQECPEGMGWSSGAGQCVSLNPEPIPQSYWDSLSNSSMPGDVALQAVQQIALPVQSPELSPVTEPLSQPYLDPVTGLPYRDMVRITPSPTPENPFRVRVDPYKQPVSSTEPDAQPVTPTEQAPVESIPPEQKALCEQFPNASACAELGSGSDPGPVEEQAVDVTAIQPVSIGATGGTCPADRVMQTQFGTLAFEWATLCAFAEGVRPVILAMAWLVAGFGFFYGAKRSQ